LAAMIGPFVVVQPQLSREARESTLKVECVEHKHCGAPGLS